MDRAEQHSIKGALMAEQEPILTDPPTQEMAHHVDDYSRFTSMMKWGAIICFIIALIVIVFVLG